MRYRRLFVEGGTYFFTVVTYRRKPIFTSPEIITLLKNAMDSVQAHHRFTLLAEVFLPDHLHVIWELPELDANYPLRWYLIKSGFSREYNRVNRNSFFQRVDTGERAVWQRRYWEHLIRDEQDLDNHLDYIHFNPVHHGLASMPGDWEYSTFHEYVLQDHYDPDWTMIPNGDLDLTARE